MTDILVVEDQLAERDILVGTIIDMGYTVIGVKDVMTAMDILDGEIFKAVLLDIMLPTSKNGEIDMDAGLKMARQISEKYESLKVVLITSRAEASTEDEIKKLNNVIKTIYKPIKISELEPILEKLAGNKKHNG